MAIIDAQGTTLTVADSLDVAQTIGNTVSYGTFAGGTRGERDRTTLASTAREYGYGLKDNGTFTIEAFYDGSDAGQTELLSLHRAATAEVREFVLTLSDGETHTFNGIVTEAPMEIPLDADVTISYSVRITGAITVA